MKAKLRGVSGPATGMEAVLELGVAVLVGRHPTCDWPLAGDSHLSGRHFAVALTEQGIVLRDMGSSNGTFVNGERIQDSLLQGGESFRAGGSTFQIELGGASAPSVVDVLSSQAEGVYAVLDAARDPAIFPMLLTSGALYGSLYAGESARKLEAVAPYLVYLTPRSDVLQTIVAKGWGNSWGIFLTSAQPMETVWHELRRSLMVTLETTGKYVYFRFYDPRVLRVFLPVAEPEQRAQMFGTISSLLLEGDEPAQMLRFTASGGIEGVSVALANAPKVEASQPQVKPLQGTQVYRTGSR